MFEVEVGDVVIMEGAAKDSVEFRRVMVKEVHRRVLQIYFLMDGRHLTSVRDHISESETKLYQSRYGRKHTGLMRTIDQVELSEDQGDETL